VPRHCYSFGMRPLRVSLAPETKTRWIPLVCLSLFTLHCSQDAPLPSSISAQGAKADGPDSEPARSLPAGLDAPTTPIPSAPKKSLIPRYQGEMIEGASALYSGDFSRAKAHYIEAMRLRPERMAPALGALRAMSADKADDTQKRTEAMVRGRVADLEAIPEAEGAAHLLSARLAIALQQPAEALDAARLAVESMPTHGVSWRVLGEAAILAEQWGRAQSSLKRAANLGLNAKAGTWERMANVLDELGELKGAERSARRALELTGSDIHARRRRLNLLAAVLKHRGRLEESSAVLKQAQELGPKDPAVVHNLATLAEAKGEHDAALRLYREALSQGGSPMSSWRYAHLLLKLDRPQEALEAFTAAAAQIERWTWPRSTRWWPAFEVGKMYAKSGHEKEALPWFENALREANVPSDVRSIRSWLSFSRVKSGVYTPAPEEP